MRMRLCLTVFVALTAATSFADNLVVPLSGLAGMYDSRFDIPPNGGETARVITVSLPPEIDHIESLSLVVSGEWHYGLQVCPDFDPPYELEPYHSYFFIDFACGGTSPMAFQGTFGREEGTFENMTVSLSYHPTDDPEPFDCLLDEPIEIWLSCSQNGPMCTPTVDAYGTLTDVHLEITGSVATTPSAWGALKALYR